MRKIFITLFVLLFSAPVYAEIKYKTYNKLPCNFNSAYVGNTARIAFETKRKCKHIKGYSTKRGSSIVVRRGTPIFAITDMKLLYAEDRSAKFRSKRLNESHKDGTDKVYDDIELLFFDKDKNQILFYHLMDTPFVPGFGKGVCERPSEFGTEKWKRKPNNCGGYSKEIRENGWQVKKGDLIGHSGTTGNNAKTDPHISFSFIINKDNLTEKEKKLCAIKVKKIIKKCNGWSACKQCYKSPEGRKDIVWENFPTNNSDRYLLPIVNKKYYNEIGYDAETRTQKN